MKTLQMEILKAHMYLMLLIPVYVAWRVSKLCKTRQGKPLDELIYGIAFCYFIFILSVTVIPDWTYADPYNTGDWIRVPGFSSPMTPNLIPFKSILMYLTGDIRVNEYDKFYVAAKNIIGNILLFVPIGFFVPAICTTVETCKKTLIKSIQFAILIEIIQFLTGRSTDIDDVLLRAIGLMIGYWLGRILLAIVKALQKQFNSKNEGVGSDTEL